MSAYLPVASLWDLAEKFGQNSEDVIKLDAGENQFGYSPLVQKALRGQPKYNFYPDPEYMQLRFALAEYTGAAVKNIMVGSGSDELLDLLFRLILNNGDEVINCPPTFGMYCVSVQLNRGVVVAVARNADFSLDLIGIRKAVTARTKAIVICSPNNPTGTVSGEEEIITLLKTGKLVIVDEAYFEFSGKSVISLLEQYPNLIVLRTLSKWAGLAGLRLGYGVMNEFFVQQLFKIKPPYNVNLAANEAGIAALSDTTWREKMLATIVAERTRLNNELEKLSCFTVYPSAANSLFIVMDRLSQLQEILEKRKIVVRYYTAYSAIRISIGTRRQNDKLLAALREYSKPKLDSVIFDMDGVLIDVSQSYRQAIKLTVEYVLQNNYGLHTVIAAEDVESMKLIPGFNNDWDLSFALIQLLSKKIYRTQFKKKITALSDQIKNSSEYQKIKDIFQSFYLGSELFFEIYQRLAPISEQSGLIANEILLIDLAVLKKIANKYKVGVATGRPKFEALFALRNLKISPALIQEKFVVGKEDTLREKPFPDPLLQAAALLDSNRPIYVGDSINDVLAAKSAQMPCIFVGTGSAAEFEVAGTNEIERLLL